MSLLFDQNLSPRLVSILSDIFPGSVHVREIGLERAEDSAVWAHAAQHGFAIVSKDPDFHQRSPPKGDMDSAGQLLDRCNRVSYPYVSGRHSGLSR